MINTTPTPPHIRVYPGDVLTVYGQQCYPVKEVLPYGALFELPAISNGKPLLVGRGFETLATLNPHIRHDVLHGSETAQNAPETSNTSSTIENTQNTENAVNTPVDVSTAAASDDALTTAIDVIFGSDESDTKVTITADDESDELGEYETFWGCRECGDPLGNCDCGDEPLTSIMLNPREDDHPAVPAQVIDLAAHPYEGAVDLPVVFDVEADHISPRRVKIINPVETLESVKYQLKLAQAERDDALNKKHLIQQEARKWKTVALSIEQGRDKLYDQLYTLREEICIALCTVQGKQWDGTYIEGAAQLLATEVFETRKLHLMALDAKTGGGE